MKDKECLDCKHHKSGGCDTWCENGEEWIPLNRNDYVKVVHAKWIGKPLGGYSTVRCSNCNMSFKENNGRWKYCPECGAKMDFLYEYTIKEKF